jgi:hypothetical protein
VAARASQKVNSMSALPETAPDGPYEMLPTGAAPASTLSAFGFVFSIAGVRLMSSSVATVRMPFAGATSLKTIQPCRQFVPEQVEPFTLGQSDTVVLRLTASERATLRSAMVSLTIPVMRAFSMASRSEGAATIMSMARSVTTTISSMSVKPALAVVENEVEKRSCGLIAGALW